MRLCATRAGFTVSGNNVLRIWKTAVADLVFLLKCRDINIHDGFTVNFLERSVVEQSNGNSFARRFCRNVNCVSIHTHKVKQKYNTIILF